MACYRVLAHEACHHFLNHAGMAVRDDERRNERLTEMAMFVCGLGQLAIDGEMALTTLGLRCDPSLGYMDHRAMLQAEETVQRQRGSITRESVADSGRDDLERRARRLFNEPGQYERMLNGYRRAYPGDPATKLLQRMVDDLQRDRR